MSKIDILVPILNANEPEARLVAILVKDGQFVEKGFPLFTIETTKAAEDIESSQEGYVHLLVTSEEILVVGQRLAVLTDTPDELVEIIWQEPDARIRSNLRITTPAKVLAESMGVDFASLPTDRLVTESIVRQFIVNDSVEMPDLPPSEKPYLLIYGAGGHAKSVMEIVLQAGQYSIAGIVDDNPSLTGKKVMGVPVLGGRSLLPVLLAKGVTLAANSVGGILDIGVRVLIFEHLRKTGFSFATLVHPRATLESTASVGEGVQVFANAYIGAQAAIQEGSIINTSAVVSHDCDIGAYTHIAPGALLAGHVHVGDRCLVGMGVTSAVGISIGARARIGNSAILLADVPEHAIVQAGRTWIGKEKV